MTSPENDRRLGGPYDPHEPFIVSYGDLLAARNAVTELLLILRDTHHPVTLHQRESILTGLRYGVVPRDETYALGTVDDAVGWLRDLQGRLTGCLPIPSTGPDRPL